MKTDSPSNNFEPAKTACGGRLKNTDGYPSEIYEGERTYFCSEACLRLFRQYPDEFMAGQIEHPAGDN